jgi:hypothetical protein
MLPCCHTNILLPQSLVAASFEVLPQGLDIDNVLFPALMERHPTGPVGCFPRRRSQGEANNVLHRGGRKRLLPGLRALSRVSPSTPSAMNRACNRHTTGFDLPDRRMTSAVPQLSSVARDSRTTTSCPSWDASGVAVIHCGTAKLQLTCRPD